MSNILDTEVEIMEKAELVSTSASEIINLIEQLTDKMASAVEEKGLVVNVSAPNIGAYITRVPSHLLKGKVDGSGKESNFQVDVKKAAGATNIQVSFYLGHYSEITLRCLVSVPLPPVYENV